MSETRLCVATHNICHMGKDPVDRTELFPDGTYRNGYEAGMTALMKNNWDRVLSSFSADLIGAQEYFPWFDLAHTMRTKETVFWPHGYEVHDGGHGLALLSKSLVTHVEEADFGEISKRRWQKFYLELGYTRIAVFNTHPMPKKEHREIRAREYGFLIREFQKEPCFLAFGDFNAHDGEEFEPFRQAGFRLANDGFSTTEIGSPCDNIIVSPNIRLEHVTLFDRILCLSDHMILYADAILDENT